MSEGVPFPNEMIAKLVAGRLCQTALNGLGAGACDEG